MKLSDRDYQKSKAIDCYREAFDHYNATMERYHLGLLGQGEAVSEAEIDAEYSIYKAAEREFDNFCAEYARSASL
jgi:hypothetical protein